MFKDNNVPETIITVYFPYVQGHILYSIVIWGASPYMEEITVSSNKVIQAMASVRFCWDPEKFVFCNFF
jgi:hypothetical protein